ncbi:hypothetical protein [Parvicella tangerina]|uniref:Uncharacterized protein n=1 Tax=Parvicella tangerina TaxID=2829795 RepID=A0A916JQ87_9FLAO|nr:hypothetical protein [Parvicella tangerina]CAG5086843.1 hypothetical protein CRYO30217_03302 [Parvicella tangerina]
MIKLLINSVVTITVCSLLVSCSDPREILVDDPDAKEYVDELCKELEDEECNKLKNELKNILTYGNFGKEGKAQVIQYYSIKYEDLTLGDLLDTDVPEVEK